MRCSLLLYVAMASETNHEQGTARSSIPYEKHPFDADSEQERNRRLQTQRDLRITAFYDLASKVNINYPGGPQQHFVVNAVAQHKHFLTSIMNDAITFWKGVVVV